MKPNSGHGVDALFRVGWCRSVGVRGLLPAPFAHTPFAQPFPWSWSAGGGGGRSGAGGGIHRPAVARGAGPPSLSLRRRRRGAPSHPQGRTAALCRAERGHCAIAECPRGSAAAHTRPTPVPMPKRRPTRGRAIPGPMPVRRLLAHCKCIAGTPQGLGNLVYNHPPQFGEEIPTIRQNNSAGLFFGEMLPSHQDYGPGPPNTLSLWLLCCQRHVETLSS